MWRAYEHYLETMASSRPLRLTSLKGRPFRMRLPFLAAVLAMASFTAAYAKSYEIELHEAAKAGKIELKPGVYRLLIDGDKAVFTDRHNASYTTPVKVENGTKKFKSTNVDSQGDHIKYIELGGSTAKVEFIE
jgi:hypothetical protein